MAINRVYDTAASLGTSSTTSTSDQTKVTLTFTPSASTRVLVLACGIVNLATSATNKVVVTKLKKDGTEVAADEKVGGDISPYRYAGVFFCDSFVSDASPSSVTYTLTYATSDAAYSASISDAVIFYIELTDDDEYAESTSDSSTSSQNTWLDKVSLTFAPGTSGDYAVLGFYEMYDTQEYPGYTRILEDGGAITGTMRPATDQQSFPCASSIIASSSIRTLDTSSHTLKLQYNQPYSNYGIASLHIRRARLLAVRLDGFDNAVMRYMHHSTTATSWTDSSSTFSESLAAVPHLMLFTGENFSSGSFYACYSDLYIDGASILTRTYSGTKGGWTGTALGSLGMMRVLTPSSDPTTAKNRLYSQSSGSMAYNYVNSLFAFQLEAAASASSNSGLLLLGVG